MKTLQSEQEFEQLKNEEKVIFLFSADWCPDCRVIEPVLPEIENKYSEYQFVYVDRDEFIDICINNDIFGIPSFLAYENGNELGRFVSKDRKTQEEIENFIEGLA
ncbi:thioredoxin family protein [Gracilibacillus sp. S3-1-1]|uniref:Thioredoxin family protein n=1 Tax=Gracilibacillus pellucidus TaxID=3095368 RepID=A0ACC6M933_9BACI|nr:thioredoxin family protein [Gracilibacillus sp. S3-1-1]MDX8047479.1 thioredoxin family protein [Gracilibacillus sp. S3-1-1]